MTVQNPAPSADLRAALGKPFTWRPLEAVRTLRRLGARRRAPAAATRWGRDPRSGTYADPWVFPETAWQDLMRHHVSR